MVMILFTACSNNNHQQLLLAYSQVLFYIEYLMEGVHLYHMGSPQGYNI